MITLTLTPREVEVIRMALRTEYTSHQRNDFHALCLENQELRGKIADAMIDNAVASRVQ